MGYNESSRFCPHCNEQRLVRHRTPSHIFHFIMTLVTFGVWGIAVWLPVSLTSAASSWRCSQCGSKVS